ncbi:MAG: hypothetical protein OXI79_14830 [Gammaproteobacteria bacterium]|nr:hypothetical protein [Gammaproteobacteria bacterium]
MGILRLAGQWWSRPPEPPAPTNAGRDVTERVLRAMRWAMHGDEGAGERDPAASGAVTLCAAAWERALSAAAVAGPEPTASAVRTILAHAGRAAVEAGEAAWMIHADGARLELEPVAILAVRGTWSEPAWEVSRWSDAGRVGVRCPAEKLLRVAWCPDPASAGLRGRPPWAGGAARAAANAEGQIGDIAALPSGHSLTFTTAEEVEDDTLQEWMEDIEAAYGRGNRSGFAPMVVQGSRRNEAVPHKFLQTYRGEFDAGASAIHEALTAAVAAACGVPPVLLSRTVAGAGFRDAWRAFVTTTVQTAADVLAAACRAQLGAEVEISAAPKHQTAADLVSRARAAGSLVRDAGQTPADAMRTAGLD